MEIKRDHITINIGSENYWLSIVETSSDDDSYITGKEMALVARSNNSFMGIRLIPLREWFDSANPDDIIQLEPKGKVRYHLLQDATEGEIVMQAIVRAKKYFEELPQ